MHFIIVNGAPGVGKDTFGALVMSRLREAGIPVIHGRIKDVLYKATARRYGLQDLNYWIEVCNDTELKETPMAILHDRTPRDVLKYESEEVIKVLKGETGVVEDYLKDLIDEHSLTTVRTSVIVFTDGGFQSETDWLINTGLPFSEDIIVRLCRSGYNFANDTREYLKQPKYIFLNQDLESLDTMAEIVTDDLLIGYNMKKKLTAPPVTIKKRFRAAMATAIMLSEGSIKFYEVGLAYKTNLRLETSRKW